MGPLASCNFKPVWEFLNKHYNFSYPFPDVKIEIIPEEILKVINDAQWEAREVTHGPENPYEAEAIKRKWDGKTYCGDGGVYPPGGFPDSENDWFIYIAERNMPDNKFTNLFDRQFQIKIHKWKGYVTYVILHEFIHILEYLTGDHTLCKNDGEDWILYYKFIGFDECVKIKESLSEADGQVFMRKLSPLFSIIFKQYPLTACEEDDKIIL
jgi:hypothetical protein